MTIEEIQKLRAALEARLTNVASEIVDDFQRRTGVSVTSVDIYLVDVTDVSSKRPESKVSSARLRVEI